MQLHFRKWVDKFGGIPKLAQELEVGEHAVRIWLRGDGCPNNPSILKILLLSKGELTFQQIYKEATRNLKKEGK